MMVCNSEADDAFIMTSREYLPRDGRKIPVKRRNPARMAFTHLGVFFSTKGNTMMA